MTDVAEIGASVSAALTAGLLLAATGHLRALDLPCPSASEILAATGASRSRAYELRDAVLATLPSLQRPVGRPPAPPREAEPDVAHALRGEALTYVCHHAGSVTGGAERLRYSDAFRHFIVALRERHQDVALELFAAAIQLPLGTLKDWLGVGSSGAPDVDDQALDDDTPASAVTQTILAAWDGWSGGISAFYAHVRNELRIDYGRSLINRILELHGRRQAARRPGRSPDERALRGAFQTFFAGAQWVGDGMTVPVTLNGERFVFNLELMIDAHTGAWAGASLRDAEDSVAVTEALADGIATTGEAPLAVLLDNKPSNHTAEVDAALGDVTERIRATLFRPQNKAHCEGAFGLFAQTAPPLALFAAEPRELARQVLALVVQTFGRTLNHRPRRDRGGRTRAELYNDDDISAEDLDAARRALEERRKKQERARETLLARQNPAVRALLDETFSRLALADPEQHLRAAIARYPLDVIVDGVAIFEGKRRAGTLPAGVDARYLLGIVRNVGDQHEGLLVAEELLRGRQEARDRLLAPLVRARDATRSTLPEVRERVLHFVDLALTVERRVDRLFWLLTVADEIDTHAKDDPAPLLIAAARRIHCTHRLPYVERQEAARIVVANVVPLR